MGLFNRKGKKTYKLGREYYYGDDIEKKKQALALLEQSLAEGCTDGLWLIAYCYHHGDCFTKIDIDKAIKYYEMANKTGEPDTSLADCYMERGLEGDIEAAYKIYSDKYKKYPNNEKALAGLARCTYYGLCVEKDVEKCIHGMLPAVLKEDEYDITANYIMGDYYWHEKGDIDKAAKYFRRGVGKYIPSALALAEMLVDDFDNSPLEKCSRINEVIGLLEWAEENGAESPFDIEKLKELKEKFSALGFHIVNGMYVFVGGNPVENANVSFASDEKNFDAWVFAASAVSGNKSYLDALLSEGEERRRSTPHLGKAMYCVFRAIAANYEDLDTPIKISKPCVNYRGEYNYNFAQSSGYQGDFTYRYYEKELKTGVEVDYEPAFVELYLHYLDMGEKELAEDIYRQGRDRNIAYFLGTPLELAVDAMRGNPDAVFKLYQLVSGKSIPFKDSNPITELELAEILKYWMILLYERNARNGNVFAMNQLWKYGFAGDGNKNYASRLYWCRKAIELHSTDMKFNLAKYEGELRKKGQCLYVEFSVEMLMEYAKEAMGKGLAGAERVLKMIESKKNVRLPRSGGELDRAMEYYEMRMSEKFYAMYNEKILKVRPFTEEERDSVAKADVIIKNLENSYFPK